MSLTDEYLAMTGGSGADVVFETAGSPVTAAMTPYLVARGGKIILVGNIHGTPEYSFINAINKEADILTVFRYRNLYPLCIEAVASGKINVKPVVNRMLPFEQVQEAFEAAIRDKNTTLKIIVEF